MEKNQLNISYKVRFRRWNRKNYAVFAGIDKEISIGNLRSTISDKLYLKTIDTRNDFKLIGDEKNNKDSFVDEQICFNNLILSTENIILATEKTDYIGFILKTNYYISQG